jgi:hypothetical protein
LLYLPPLLYPFPQLLPQVKILDDDISVRMDPH